ncbi:hypothetical protein GCM10022198_16400 [Klugiella xanthotipulae]|uniref:Uncharacterized protein YndB with AHSA1/START domain n=1 Tax=Klugiella xanthotipulae TaxID=244735 RepID=A0A543HH64_9MICO|nr:SRPBCC domain-containing protein [Klugiella xanthotipulae]TQM57676.1 uncharacterized protein YndB with AHSA1/START domain [Klugiella xanthotipulae]
MPVGPVIVRMVLPAARQDVWDAITDAEKAAVWWPDLSLVAEVGGGISEIWSEEDSERHATGVVDIVIPGHSLGFAWRERGDDYATSVLIVLQSDGDHSRITVTETGLDNLEQANRRAIDYQQGWEFHLEDLRAYLAGELVE